jgi:hypothetical protein
VKRELEFMVERLAWYAEAHQIPMPHAEIVFECASFDPVKAGETIGHRHDGTVVSSPGDGFIVFPNTKAMPGNEWFYFAGRSSRPLNLG